MSLFEKLPSQFYSFSQPINDLNLNKNPGGGIFFQGGLKVFCAQLTEIPPLNIFISRHCLPPSLKGEHKFQHFPSMKNEILQTNYFLFLQKLILMLLY